MENGMINFVESGSIGNIILSKDSSSEQLKKYFEVVLKLYQSGEKFPVNLDDVWPLVYSQRSKAISTLKRNFLENEDFVSFSQSVEREIGGSVKVVYKLSVSCFEYFIARKVRAVFDVYRNVFKKVASGEINQQGQQKQLSAVEMFALQAQINLEAERRVQALETRLDNLEAEREENTQKLLQLPITNNPLPIPTMRKSIVAHVNEYAAATNIPQREVWHKIYANLYNLYGKSINAYKKISERESKLDVAERNNLLEPILDIISDMIAKYRMEKKNKGC